MSLVKAGTKNRAWSQVPWTCSACGETMKAGGKGSHATLRCGKDFKARFWSYVDKSDPNGCWLWIGAKHYRGYGACGQRPYGDTRAHRVSYRYTYGEIPKGLGVLHRCSVMLCVNPEHLYLGDQKQNMADRYAAGHTNNRYTPTDQLLHPQLSKRLTGRQW